MGGEDRKQQLGSRGRFAMCPARRVHPISTDYYVACSREPDHEGEHRRGDTTWTDAHEYACRDGGGEPLDWRGRQHGLGSTTRDTCKSCGATREVADLTTGGAPNFCIDIIACAKRAGRSEERTPDRRRCTCGHYAADHNIDKARAEHMSLDCCMIGTCGCVAFTEERLPVCGKKPAIAYPPEHRCDREKGHDGGCIYTAPPRSEGRLGTNALRDSLDGPDRIAPEDGLGPT